METCPGMGEQDQGRKRNKGGHGAWGCVYAERLGRTEARARNLWNGS